MVLQCLLNFTPFLLAVLGPRIAIKLFMRSSPLLQRVALAAWRTWVVGLILTIMVMVGGVLWNAPFNSSIDQKNIFFGSAKNSAAQQQAAVARISASGVAPANYLQMVYAIAAEENFYDPELIMGIIQQESRWDPNATSPSGAMGLTQLMPLTAQDMGVANAYDPEQNIRGGIKYIKFLLNRYNGDVERAVMAYHAGPGTIESSGPRPIDQYYATMVLGYYEDYEAKASMGQLLHVGVGSESCEIGPLYEYAHLTQEIHGRDYGHQAVDLRGGPGTPLYSPITGEITDIYIDGLNNTVMVIENGCWTITLMHGDWKAKIGDQVQQGDLIGWEDNNGNTWSNGRPCYGRDGCGDHTHINIYSKDQARNVDPLQFNLAVHLTR